MGNLLGKMISHYEVQALVRSDLAISVYQAEDTQSGEACLLWVAFPDRLTSDHFREDFLKQLDLLNLLDHPNLLPILGSGEENGILYWLTPDIPARPLSEIVPEQRNEKNSARLAAQVAEGVQYLHQENVIHGGLSPENILLCDDGQVRLGAFGLLPLMNREINAMLPEHTLGFGMGQPSYLAPEQIKGQEATTQSDLYALGAVYYALLNGKPAYDSPTPAETAIRQVSAPLTWPVRLRTRISNASIRLVHRCMARRESDRLKSAGEASKTLNRLAAGKITFLPAGKAVMAGAPYRPNWPFRLATLTAILALAGWIAYTHVENLAWAAKFFYRPAAAPAPTQVLAVQETRAEPGAAQAGQNAPEAQPTIAQNTPAAPGQPTATLPAAAAEEIPAADLIQPVLAGTEAPGTPEVITPANVSQIREVVRLGLGKFNQVAWKSDESVVAIASSAGVLIVGKEKLVRFLDTGDEAASVQFSRDGNTLAVGLQHGNIQMWDWQNGRLTSTLLGHSARVSRILFLPSKKQMISASYDATLRLWSNPGGEQQDIISVGGQVKDIALSADGQLVVTGSSDQWVRVWSISSGTKEAEFYHSDKVEAVAITSNGEYVAAGGPNGEVKRWGVRTKQLYGESSFLKRRVWSLYYTPGNTNLVALVDKGQTARLPAYAKTPNMKDRQEKVPNPFQSYYDIFGNDFEFLSHAEPSADGQSYITMTWDGQVKADTFLVPALAPKFDEFRRIAFSPDSSYLLFGGVLNTVLIARTDNNALVGITTGQVPPGDPFTADSKSVVLVNDETIPIKGRDPLTIEALAIYQADGLKSLKVLSEYPAGGWARFTMDDRLLVAGNMYKTRFWDVASGMETYHDDGNSLGCYVGESRNNGQEISAFSQAGLMTGWDQRVQNICSLTNAWGPRLTTISTDHQWLASFIDNGARLELYNMDSGAQQWWKTTSNKMEALAISPNGDLLAGGSPDGSITIWGMVDGQVLQTIPIAHFGAVRALTFSADGKMLASSGTDGTVRVWEVRPVR